MKNNNGSVNPDRVVRDALDRMGSLSSVKKVIPIAWPVFQVEHRLCLRIQEELGLVERHILEAIARFAPVSSDKIGDMMGLDADIVEHIVLKLGRFSNTILREGEKLRVADAVSERLLEDQWTNEVVQPYSFWVNGPTGDLLPHKAIKGSDSNLVLDFEGGARVMSREGKRLSNMCWITATQSLGARHLGQLLTDSNPASRIDFGIPETAFGVESSTRKNGFVRWEFAIGELTEDTGLKVYLDNDPNVILLEVKMGSLPHFSEALRRENEMLLFLGKSNSNKTKAKWQIPENWMNFADCEIRAEDLVVSLKNAGAVPLKGIGVDEEQNDGSSAQQRIPWELLNALDLLRYWHPRHYTLRQVVPGNYDTAAFILKNRAIKLLRRLVDKNQSLIMFERCWMEAQADLVAMWPKNVCPEPILWPEIRGVALRSTDNDLVEFVSEFQ